MRGVITPNNDGLGSLMPFGDRLITGDLKAIRPASIITGGAALPITLYCYVDEDNPNTNYSGSLSWRQQQDGTGSKVLGDRKAILRFPQAVSGYIALVVPTNSDYFTMSGAPSSPDPASFIQVDVATRTYGITNFNARTTTDLTWNNLSDLTFDAAGPYAAFTATGDGYEPSQAAGQARALQIFSAAAIVGVQLDLTLSASGLATYFSGSGQMSSAIAPYVIAGSL